MGERLDARLHLAFEVVGEPRCRAELRGVGHFVEGYPAAEASGVHLELLRDTADVRVDEVQRVVVALGEQERVVLPEDVVAEEGEHERHRPGVEDAGDAGEHVRSVLLDGFHHALEGGDVRVYPVVAVLDFDGTGNVEGDAGHLPNAGSGVADVGRIAGLFRRREVYRPGVRRRLRRVGHRGPVDGAAAGRAGDGTDATIEIHTAMLDSRRQNPSDYSLTPSSHPLCQRDDEDEDEERSEFSGNGRRFLLALARFVVLPCCHACRVCRASRVYVPVSSFPDRIRGSIPCRPR